MGHDALLWSCEGRLTILNLRTFCRTFAIISLEMTNSPLLDMGACNWFGVAPGMEDGGEEGNGDVGTAGNGDAGLEGGNATAEGGTVIVGNSDTDTGTGCANTSIPELDNGAGQLNPIWGIGAFVTAGCIGSNVDFFGFVHLFNRQTGVLGMMI